MTNTNENPINGQDASDRRLVRSVHGRMVAGVASGLAEYFDIDVSVVRLGIVVLTLMGGAGIPLYLAAWLFVPEDGAPESIAEHVIDRRMAA